MRDTVLRESLDGRGAELFDFLVEHCPDPSSHFANPAHTRNAPFLVLFEWATETPAMDPRKVAEIVRSDPAVVSRMWAFVAERDPESRWNRRRRRVQRAARIEKVGIFALLIVVLVIMRPWEWL